MGRETAENVPAARELFAAADKILGYDLLEVCANGPAERLDSTAVSQPGLFVCGLAALERLRKEAPDRVGSCEAAAGLSLGEYSALTFAGTMEFPDALRVVRARGEAMQAAADLTPSGMVSVVGLEAEPLEELCSVCRKPGETLQLANYLCPGNIVVSGSRAACDRLMESAELAGAMKVIRLAVAGAFHTPIMKPAVERLTDILADVPIKKPRIPVISNVDAGFHDDPSEIRDLLVRQVVAPVRWEDSMRRLLDLGFDSFQEIGPGRVLRGLLRRIDRKIACEGTE
jgi:[acyl-carrier-protein] S-malonyltransferase